MTEEQLKRSKRMQFIQLRIGQEEIFTSTDQKRTKDNPSTREIPRDDRHVYAPNTPRRRILSTIIENNAAVEDEGQR
jgi:hypothetical protein